MKKKLEWKGIVEKITFYLLLLLLWQSIWFFGVKCLNIWKPYAIPSPIRILDRFIDVFQEKDVYLAILFSMNRILIGFVISLLLGIVIGLLITHVRIIKRNIKPIILGMQALPSVCWVPFAILWYGLDQNAVIMIIVLGSTFSIAMAIENSIQTIDPLFIRAAKTMGCNPRQLYGRVIIPAAMPMLLSGLRQSWSFAWRALMGGEMMISMKGVGQMLDSARNIRNDINEVAVVMIIVVLVGIMVDQLIFTTIERRVLEDRGMNLDKV